MLNDAKPIGGATNMKNRTLTAGLMTAWLIACGPQGEQPSLDEGDPVGTVTQASSPDKGFIDREPVKNASKLSVELGRLSDQASKVTNVIGKVSDVAGVAVKALEMLGYLQSEAQIEQARFDALHLHLDNLGVKLVENNLAIARDERLANMRTAVNNVTVYAQRGGGRIDASLLHPWEIDELGNALTFSQNAAQFATGTSAHQGYYHEGVTNGDRCTGSSHADWFLDADCWKRYVSARPGPSGSIAYDWRLGTAEMLKLIASRLAIIGITDPNFRHNGERMNELWQYYESLQGYYNDMVGGIHCWGIDGNPVQVGCADIHTGLEVSTSFYEPSCHNPYNRTTCEARIAPYKERFKRSLMTQLPLFQVRSMMNALARGMTTSDELTTNPRIRLWGSQNCLSNQNVYEYDTNPYEPTLVPGEWIAGIGTCSSSDVAQEWHYDRDSGQIKNAWGACLGQRSFDLNNLYYGGQLWAHACNNTGSQQWTYDPWSGVLENAFHTVLGAPLQHGTWGPNIPRPELPGASATQAWGSPPLENLALNKSSWQSSNLPGYDAFANRANDGNTDGWFWNGSVTHTSNGFVYPWLPQMAGQHWYVYLDGPERHVKKINIYNRTDCCSERLSNYNVLAWISADEEWRVISDHSNDTSAPPFVSINVDVLTRYVMIAKTNDDYLQLAEVEVLGY
jgi:hypothetical protein